MIERISKLCLVSMFLLCAVTGYATAADDIAAHRSCKHCSMDRKAYGYSRMLLVYGDGSQAGVCSLHCAVTEMNSQKGRSISSILVADRDTHELIPVEKAFWTIGGKKRGVMTQVAKWAFASRESAEKFITTFGGEIASWETALAMAGKDAAP